jgi:O-antigen/teichoic acid export membrane protein
VALTVLGTALHGAYLVAVNVQFFFGTTRRLAVASVGCAGLNVALNAWWLPTLGLYGAAWATVAAYAVLAGVLWVAGVRLLRGSLVRHTALTAVTALICIVCAVPTWLAATLDQEMSPGVARAAWQSFAFAVVFSIPALAACATLVRPDRVANAMASACDLEAACAIVLRADNQGVRILK